MTDGGLPKKNPVFVLLKVILFMVLFQILLGVASISGYLLEGDIARLAETRNALMEFPDHRYLAWTGLFLLLIGMPVAGWLGRLATRDRPPQYFFLGESWMPFFRGATAGLAAAVILPLAFVLLGYGQIIAWPGRLLLQELTASILGYAMLMLFVGFYEELLYRGILACEWSRRAGSWGLGITLSGLLFGFIHVSNIDSTAGDRIRIIVSGVLFSWLLAAIMLRFRSIKAAMGVHAGWNFGLGCLMGCTVSGLHLRFTPFQTEITGPIWLSGGRFGIETSVIVNGMLVIIVPLIWRGIRPEHATNVDKL